MDAVILQALGKGGMLTDLLTKLPQVERYTYSYYGNSQALDHIFVSPSLLARTQVDVLHVNSGLAQQSSDHDPTLAVVCFWPL